jgi:predicted ATPase/class 3 adenylate cyclase
VSANDQIKTWLDGIGLPQYATVFTENAIDLEILPDVTEADLEKLGVALGHRKRILRAIAALSAGRFTAAAGALPRAVPPSEAERRQLTVLFCDLVGSTALAVKLDPEDLREVIRGFQDSCAAVITQMGGYIARFMGDGLLAYFGYPQAHEDDAERAVRAGLALAAKVSQLLLPTGDALQVRVGIATGVVIVGDTIGEEPAQEQVVVGETPNLAARLQSVAAPNTTVVAASTLRLLGDIFVCEQLGPLELKGLSESVRAWQVLGERVVESRFAAIHPTNLTRFVGRQNELHRLYGLWKRAKAGNGLVALLCGEAGIGKSRISKTLLARIVDDAHVTIRLQCSPYHTNSPFYPIITQHEHAAHFQSLDPPEAKLEKLEALLSEIAPEIVADAPLYAALLSIPTDGRYPPLDLTPRRQKDLTIEALTRQVLTLGRTKPVLFVIEDAHWIDPSTLEATNRFIEAVKTAPVFLLVTFRPEFFAPWLDQPHVTMIHIDRLGRDKASAMIRDLAGGKELPPEVLESIINKTDGVPLFVEELTKMVLESGLLREAGDRYIAVGPLPHLAIPTTLHDSLMARLDRLSPIKEVAQIGAAIGREFTYRLLAAVAPISGIALQSALEQLTRAGLIFSRGKPPDSTYIFKHALLQDAAYASLLRGRRQQLHRRIADALEDQFGELAEAQPQLMAHHLAQAGFTERAINYLQKAGQRANESSANAEAIGHLKLALEFLKSLPEGPEHKPKALELQVMLAQAMIAGRGYAASETREVLLQAKALTDDCTEVSQKFAILYGIWASYYVAGEVAMQHRAAAEFLAEAERHEETASVCLSHRTLGTTYVQMGEFSAGRQHLERARELYDPEHHSQSKHLYGQDIGATALSYLCWALWHLGYVDQAAAIAAEATKRAEALSHPFTLVYTICHARGMMDIFSRCPQDTPSYANTVISICTEHDFPFWAAGGRILDGWAMACQGEADEGIEKLDEGLAAWRKTGARLWLPIFLALKAEAHAKVGRSDTALNIIEEALAISDETGERWALAEVLRIKASLLQAAGRAAADEIEKLLLESLKTGQHQQALSWQLRTACDLSRLWQEQGRNDEALTLLQSIYNKFTEGFGTPDLIQAEALLKDLRADSVDRVAKDQTHAAGSTADQVRSER